MGLFLFRFWPALIPLLVYGVWFLIVRHQALKEGKPAPHFRNGPWYWIVISTLLIGALCFVMLGLGTAQQEIKGKYIPSRVTEDGILMPPRVIEEK